MSLNGCKQCQNAVHINKKLSNYLHTFGMCDYENKCNKTEKKNFKMAVSH